MSVKRCPERTLVYLSTHSLSLHAYSEGWVGVPGHPLRSDFSLPASVFMLLGIYILLYARVSARYCTSTDEHGARSNHKLQAFLLTSENKRRVDASSLMDRNRWV